MRLLIAWLKCHSNNHIIQNLLSVTLTNDIEEDRNSSIISIQDQNQGPLMVTASMLGLVSFILLLIALVAGIYISYRLCKHDRKVTRYRFLHDIIQKSINLK